MALQPTRRPRIRSGSLRSPGSLLSARPLARRRTP
jgi:hypothetical protein